MSNNSQNHLYVFVKGNKGIGGYEITDTDFKPKHTGTIEAEEGSSQSPFLMDLKAIEMSLEYIRDNRGNDGVPKEPVIFIFTTYENNYHVAAGIKKPKTEEMKQFKQNFNQLKAKFTRAGQKQRDEVKCYWIPDNFENCIEDVKKLLNGESS